MLVLLLGRTNKLEILLVRNDTATFVLEMKGKKNELTEHKETKFFSQFDIKSASAKNSAPTSA